MDDGSGRRGRGGAFAEALDGGIAACGLTLDRVRHRLAERGVDVSNATLSYWRRGLRRPEGAGSLRAVQTLERVLGLPPASLITLLGPPRPRGRWLVRPEAPQVAELARLLDDPAEGRCEVVSAHDVFTVAGDRSERGVRSRLVLRGVRGRVGRYLVRYQADGPGSAPALLAAHFCRVGRVVGDPGSGLVVAELLLDRPLTAGRHAVVEYEMCAPAGPAVEVYYRRLAGPVAEYSQIVRFEGDPPMWCGTFRKADFASPEHDAEQAQVGPSGTTCLVAFDERPGVVGTRWRW
ncbi:XRE family transcriptional regulator [Actinosynnema sp. NPDC050436]|uniref:XRE family transcriptional regulator n=1 Tax=Actinosynnema sp. NPDC050436 TaxID=3155659 RepID=UPI003403959A